jgi:hypothetical protein
MDNLQAIKCATGHVGLSTIFSLNLVKVISEAFQPWGSMVQYEGETQENEP